MFYLVAQIESKEQLEITNYSAQDVGLLNVSGYFLLKKL